MDSGIDRNYLDGWTADSVDAFVDISAAGAVIGHCHSNRINPVLGCGGLRDDIGYPIESKCKRRKVR